jgi:hypothetical protein
MRMCSSWHRRFVFGFVLVSVTAAIIWSRFVPESLPREWPGKEEFCSQATLLGVGEPQLSVEGRDKVFFELSDSAPAPLRDEFAAISRATTSSANQVDHETIVRMGVFIEDRCNMNLPGVTAEQ